MKAVVQRVSRASVRIDGQTVGEIGRGLLVLLGIGKNDVTTDTDWMIKKLLALRIFPDDAKNMNRSVTDIGGGILVVSQFTLYGDARKGTRPSFTDAMPPTEAERFYNDFMGKLRGATSLKVAEGKFAAMMDVELVNDGPVTIVLDSKSVERASRPFTTDPSTAGSKQTTTTVVPFDPSSSVVKSKRNLPHWQQEGRTYFVTFRLVDSLPQEKLQRWLAERQQWSKVHPKPWTDAEQEEFDSRFIETFEQWLDAGYGACWLKNRDIAAVTVEALGHFDRERYVLHSFVVMPNHVHVMITPLAGHAIAGIIHSWKSFTSHEINRILNHRREVWHSEYFDRIVRNEEAFAHIEEYIRHNPSTAGLQPGDYVCGP